MGMLMVNGCPAPQVYGTCSVRSCALALAPSRHKASKRNKFFFIIFDVFVAPSSKQAVNIKAKAWNLLYLHPRFSTTHISNKEAHASA